ncbi:phosphonate metabolism transcriptional regulator PhnF [Stappia sp.]|uniref:phosphonate metabolism transcriptional regulator PhnF n=1 Tax=Stappia sp. TaxID=1870903 RepID=UPI0032D902B9
MGELERRSGVALWRQIADDIRAAIGNGAYDETGKLPTEAALAAQFDVNRHTVRQALAALARDGLVTTVQGRGTSIVPHNRVTYPIGPRTRFSAGLGGQVARATTRLVEAVTEPASEAVAKALHLAPDTPVIRLESVGEADGTSLSRATSWFDADRFAELPAHYARDPSITRALAACGVTDYVRVATEISAAPATSADRADLGLQPGAVVLVTIAVNADPQGRPIQYSRTRFAAERVRLAVHSETDTPSET